MVIRSIVFLLAIQLSEIPLYYIHFNEINYYTENELVFKNEIDIKVGLEYILNDKKSNSERI